MAHSSLRIKYLAEPTAAPVKALRFRNLPMASSTILDIAIVGAGIAGLGAAIALSRSGHKVEVGSLGQSVFRCMELTNPLASTRSLSVLSSPMKLELRFLSLPMHTGFLKIGDMN
jgi:hypothetical protein